MLKDLGHELRRAREAKGLTIKDVQAETKIRSKYLEAIEDGDLSVIPGEVYAKGFVRSYANFLGLDGGAILDKYKQWKAGQPAADGPDSPPAVGTPPRPPVAVVRSPAAAVHLPGVPKPLPRGMILFLSAVLLVLLAAGGLLWYGTFSAVHAPGDKTSPAGGAPKNPGGPGSGTLGTPKSPPGTPGSSGPNPAQLPPGTGKGSDVAVTRGAPSGQSIPYAVYAAAQEPIRLTIRTEERCWAEAVEAGEEVLYSGILEAGASRSWDLKAGRALSLRLGNPKAVRVYINDRVVDELRFTEPRTLVFSVTAR